MKKYLTNPVVLWFAVLGSAAGQTVFQQYLAPDVSFGMGVLINGIPPIMPDNSIAMAVWDRLPDSTLAWLLSNLPV